MIGISVLHLPADLRHHNTCPHLWQLCGSHEVLAHVGVHGCVALARLLPDSPRSMAPGW